MMEFLHIFFAFVGMLAILYVLEINGFFDSAEEKKKRKK